MNGQGQHPSTQVLRDRKGTLRVTRVQVGFLVVQGNGVINHGRNLPGRQGIPQSLTIQVRMQAQGVLMEDVGAVVRRLGHAEPRRSAQQAVVGRGGRGPGTVVAVQVRKFGPQDHGLHRVQTGIDPDFVVVVLNGLPVVGHFADSVG